ncbi:transposase [Viscerimonas tarda]
MPNHLHGIIEIISNVGVEYFRPEKDVIADTRVEKDVIVDTRVEKDVIVDTRVEKDVIVDTRVEKDVIVDTRVEKYVIVDTRVENIRPLRERPNCESGSIGAIVRGFKIGITKKIGYSVWQRNYYEHIIHSSNDYARIVDYIENNPARWEVDKLYKG